MRRARVSPGHAPVGRSYRLLATAFLFFVFGLGGLAACLFVFPVIALTARDPTTRVRRARAVIGLAFRSFLWLMALLRVARFEIDRAGCESLGAERGAIVVANHPTLIDVVFLLAYIRQANCVVKAQVWRNPCMSLAVRTAGYIPNGRLDVLLESCAAAMKAGELLIIFPEATRTVPGHRLRLQRGAANIAVRSGAKVRFVHFGCDPAMLSKAEPWYRIPRRQPCFRMKVGGSLHARDFRGRGEQPGIAARRLTNVLEKELSTGLPGDDEARERA